MWELVFVAFSRGGIALNAIQNTERRFYLAELLQKLRSTGKGLSDSGSKERLQKYGYNEITEKKVHPLCQVPELLLGTDPLDDRSCGCFIGKILDRKHNR